MIDTLTIAGLRGFGKEQTIVFAKPDHQKEGSGLTFIVGANNTGKTTIAEAIRSFNCTDQAQSPTFSSDKRNSKNNDRVVLQLKNERGVVYTIKTVLQGGSQTEIFAGNNMPWESQKIYVLNSRRSVQFEFQRFEQDKLNYLNNQLNNQSSRSPYLQDFGSRLNRMNNPENRKIIDPMLNEILGARIDWTIDENINRQCYLKIKANGIEHISEGMGDGIWSVFTICDALYDLQENETLMIDEPELSLHPVYQKRVMRLLKREAKNKQIIISTHSPYFIDAEAFTNGATLIRTHKDKDGDIEVFCLPQIGKLIHGLLNDANQPHTFGVEAKEIFFVDDRVIVTEGQEDVVMYNKAIEELGIKVSGDFFGWGAGGASKIPVIIDILNRLGYKKVSAIYDGDKLTEKKCIEARYPNYRFYSISKHDVRDKPAVNAKPEKEGLLKSNGEIKEESKTEIKSLFLGINDFFEEA